MTAASDFITRSWCRFVAATTREDGQAVTEYAVVLVLIAAVAAALTTVGSGIPSQIVQKITDTLKSI